MIKILPGQARGIIDPTLGPLDELLDGASAGRAIEQILVKHSAIDPKTLVPESVRWKPGVGLNVTWRWSFDDGHVERVTVRAFENAARAQSAFTKATTHNLVETERLRAIGIAPNQNLVLVAFPNDRELYALPRLLDPSRAKHVLGKSIRWIAAKQLRVRARATSAEVMRYKPERRCVIRYESSLADDTNGTKSRLRAYARVLTRTTAGRVAEVLDAIANLQLPIVAHWGYDPETSTLFQAEAEGQFLESNLTDLHGFEAAAAALRRLHDAPVPAISVRENYYQRAVALADESNALSKGGGPEFSRLIGECFRNIFSAAADTPGRITLVHGDYHPGQCAYTNNGASLFDLDCVALDAPARDLGHFLAALEARVLLGSVSAGDAARARETFLNSSIDPDPRELAREEALALVEHALSPIRRLEQDCFERATQLCESALRVLKNGRSVASAPPVVRLFVDNAQERARVVHRLASSSGDEASAEVVRVTPYDGAKAGLEMRVRREGMTLYESRFYIMEDGHLRVPLDSPLDNPAFVTALLKQTPECRGVEIRLLETTLLSGRPEKRATVLAKVALNGEGSGKEAGKKFVVRWTRSKSNCEKAEFFRNSALANSDPQLVAPLLVDFDSHCAVYPFVPGQTLHEILRSGATPHPDSTVNLIRRFHAYVLPGNGISRDLAGELETIDRLRQRYASVGVPEPPGLESYIQQLRQTLPLSEHRSAQFIHGDLYDRQIIYNNSGQPHLIDLDTSSAGNPLIDIGNFIAHLELARMEGARGSAIDLWVSALASEWPSKSGALDWAAAASLVRISIVHYPRSAGPVAGVDISRALLSHAQKLLDQIKASPNA